MSKNKNDSSENILADDACVAGADAFVGTSIKCRYNTMKRLVYFLEGLAVVSSAVNGYLMYSQRQQTDNCGVRLRQTVPALPKDQLQCARMIYAGSVIKHIKENPDMGVVEATKASVQYVEAQYVEAKKNNYISPAVRHMISNDLMTMAQSFEDRKGLRCAYLRVMMGYSKNNIPIYTNRQSSQKLVESQLVNYLLSGCTR